MKKSVAVLGLGKYGKSLSENLYQMGADVLAVDNNAAELHIGRLRVVVHLQCGQLPAAAVVVGADTLMVGHVAQPRFLHHNKGAVVKHLPMLCGSYCRTANKHKDKKGSSHLSD